ncbi:MAG: AMP-binding protein [Bacteroidales bacterium]
MALSRILYYHFKLNRNVHKDRHSVLRQREARLRRLLKYAFRHSDFYRKYYADHGINSGDLGNININHLPVIDKKMMMDHFDDFLVAGKLTKRRVEDFLESTSAPDNTLYDKYHVIHSSGTTGEVGYFVYNPREWDFIKAISLRIFPHFGLKPKSYAFIGVADGHYAGVSLFLSPLHSPESFVYRDYLVLDINYPLEQYLDVLNRLNPAVITGYPTGVGMLAEMQKSGKLSVSPQALVCGGEPLTPETEKLIHEVWECQLINYYASSESLIMGVERADLKGFYLFDDVNYIEFRDDHILLTNLYNYTQPLIRYRMDDVLVPQGEGDIWPFTRIKHVIGRREELLWFINQRGEYDFIHPIVIVEFYVRGLEKYQVLKTGNTSFTFKTVISNQFNEEQVIRKIDEAWREILKKKEMLNLDYRIEAISDIPIDPKSGKFKLIMKK